jgi:acyl carrier protein
MPLTRDEIRSTALQLLAEIAPELDPGALAGDVPLRDQVDLDSMDFLNYLISIHQALAVDIPEEDYDRLATLDGLVAYVDEALRAAPSAGDAA